MEPWTNNRVLQMNQRCNEMSTVTWESCIDQIQLWISQRSQCNLGVKPVQHANNGNEKIITSKQNLFYYSVLIMLHKMGRVPNYNRTDAKLMVFNVKKENDKVTIVGSEIILCCPLAGRVKTKSLPHVQRNDFIFSQGILIDSVEKSSIA